MKMLKIWLQTEFCVCLSTPVEEVKYISRNILEIDGFHIKSTACNYIQRNLYILYESENEFLLQYSIRESVLMTKL